MDLSRPTSLIHHRRPARRSLRRTPAPAPSRERNQRANISQDAAVYTCSCGYVFKAEVTTSIGCPHCGTDQAW